MFEYFYTCIDLTRSTSSGGAWSGVCGAVRAMYRKSGFSGWFVEWAEILRSASSAKKYWKNIIAWLWIGGVSLISISCLHNLQFYTHRWVSIIGRQVIPYVCMKIVMKIVAVWPVSHCMKWKRSFMPCPLAFRGSRHLLTIGIMCV